MPRTLWLVLIGLLLSLVTVGCRQQQSAWDAMVTFDQAYIPALAFTSQLQGDGARAVMPRVKARWQTLQERVPAEWTRQEGWRQVTASITGRLQRADALIAEGHLTEAHEELEGVRELLMTQRSTHDIDYFVDRLTAYHEPMEAIVLVAKGKSPVTLTDENVAVIRRHLQEAHTRWTLIEPARVDAQRYQLTDDKAAALHAGIIKESAALKALQTALESGDRQRIIQTAAAIKPPFAQLFMLFGDFSLSGR